MSRYRYRLCRGIAIWSVYTRTISQYRRPAPRAGAFQGGGQQTTAQHQNLRVGFVWFGPPTVSFHRSDALAARLPLTSAFLAAATSANHARSRLARSAWPAACAAAAAFWVSSMVITPVTVFATRRARST